MSFFLLTFLGNTHSLFNSQHSCPSSRKSFLKSVWNIPGRGDFVRPWNEDPLFLQGSSEDPLLQGSSPKVQKTTWKDRWAVLKSQKPQLPGWQPGWGRGPAGGRSRFIDADAAESPGEIKVKGSSPAQEEAHPCVSIRGAETGWKAARAVCQGPR